MKTLTLLLAVLFSFPQLLSAQSVEGLLQNVSDFVDAGQRERAVDLFRQAIRLNADKSEMFYWTRIDKDNDIAIRLVQELVSYYRDVRNYDKVYLFCKELLQKNPNNVEWLAVCAEAEVCRGKEKDALQTYEKILSLDKNHLEANIFVGNYYYLMAEREKQQIVHDYQQIASPTRMQYARYKDGINKLMTEGYGKAKTYLQNVVRQFPSTEVKKTLEKIRKMEMEMK